MEDNGKLIGFVSSSLATPSSESRFNFIITDKNIRLQQFDVIKVKDKSEDGDQANSKDIYLYAIVESVSYVSDAPDHIANYISYNFGHIPEEEEQLIHRVGFYQVSSRPFYQKNDDFFPVKTGDRVYLCNKEELNEVLNADFNKGKEYFPVAEKSIGVGKEENVSIFLNRRFLLGPDAAHLNISGMSGMAAKTTKAMIILRQLFITYSDVELIIFNTKDQDLLNLQKKEDNTEWSKQLQYLRPKSANQREGYIVDYITQREKSNLDLLVASDPDENGNMDSCTRAVEHNNNIQSWKDLREIKKEENDSFGNDFGVTSINKYKRHICRVIDAKMSGIFSQVENAKDISKRIDEYLRDDEHRHIVVVDIAPLDLLQQAFVFGCVIREIQNYCQIPQKTKKVAVFVDELNRYASEDIPQSNPILQMLIEIAETGRSNGLCLVTAEQSLSVIHKRIKSNIGTYIYGKTGIVELSQPDYRMIPESFKNRMMSFQHGDALISTPTLNVGYTRAKFEDKFWDENSGIPQE